MSGLLTSFWPAIAASGLLGAGIGAWLGLPRSRGARIGAGVLAVALLALLAVAVAGIAPGRIGLGVEGAALVLAAYLAGALIGGFASSLRRRSAVPDPASA